METTDSLPDISDLDAQSALLQAELQEESFIDRETTKYLDEISSTTEIISSAETVTPETLAMAMERFDHIASLYDIQTIGLAREGFVDMAVQKGAAMKDEVVKRGFSVAQGVIKTMIQRANNTLSRMGVNLRTMFKRASTYVADANAIKVRAERLKITNAQNHSPDAAYTKVIKVAHFTRGDQGISSTGGEILDAMKANFAAFQEVGSFMAKFDKVFDYGVKNKGAVDFDELAGGFESSLYFPHEFTLSGQAALFGEEFLLTKFGGQSSNIEQMIAIIRGMHVSHEYIWRVKELQQPSLPALTPAEITQSINQLMQAGQFVYEFSRTWAQTVGKYMEKATRRASTPPWQNMDFYTSPGNYILYNNLYCNIILSLGNAVAQAITTNEKALLCLLDYYKWSLKQYR